MIIQRDPKRRQLLHLRLAPVLKTFFTNYDGSVLNMNSLTKRGIFIMISNLYQTITMFQTVASLIAYLSDIPMLYYK